MRNKKGTILTPGSGGDRPLAPTDLWEQMDALTPPRVATRPENSFTVMEFAERKGLSASHSGKVVLDLYRQGKLQRVKFGKEFYYLLASG